MHLNRVRLHFSSSICALVARSSPRDAISDAAKYYSNLPRRWASTFRGVTVELDSGRPRQAILDKARRGQERYRVSGTPTLMLADGPSYGIRLHSRECVRNAS